MRLIDADELKNDFRWSEVCRLSILEIIKIINDAPTCENRHKGEWIPVTFRQMTEEEVKEACKRWGVDEEILDEYDKRIFTCPLPEDGQDILVSYGGRVSEDICCWDEDFCGLEYNGDWDGIDAWMLPPNPYKKGET